MQRQDIKTQRDILHDYVDKRNQLEAWIDLVIPYLQDKLAEGFKQKESGSLYKKDEEALAAIVASNLPEGARALG